MTRAFITGITGMVGSHLADYLYAHTDWEIIGMARWRSPLDNLAGLAAAINDGKRVRLIYADLRDTLAVQHAMREARPDIIFHLAAQSFPRTSLNRRWILLTPTCKAPCAFWKPPAPMHRKRSFMFAHLPKCLGG